MNLFYCDLGNHPNKDQSSFDENDTHGSLSIGLNECVKTLNSWSKTDWFKPSFIVEVEVNNYDLVNGLNAAMIGNSHYSFNGKIINIYEPTYNRSSQMWEVII